MDRELVLLVLLPALTGPLLSMAGLWPSRRNEPQCAQLAERRRWREIWAPCIPAAVSLALLIGWAKVEPEHAEVPRGMILVVAACFALLWLRAAVRALWVVLHHVDDVPACTVGLLRPRVRLSRAFLDAVDWEAVEAARAHELAHAGHRDPLRLWLAQLVTDLQWPVPAARERLRTWQRTLELARDEEARRRGVCGEDLAAAIIAATQLRMGRPAGAGLLGNGSTLRERVRRALTPLPSPPPEDTELPGRIAGLLILLLASAAIGAQVGETLVRAILR